MFSLTGSYIYGAKLSVSDFANIFAIPENQIQEVGTYSAIGGHLEWGPYLYHSGNSALVLQASGGLAGAFFSDPAAKNNSNSLLFKEFRGGGPLLLTYGANLRFFTNNFMIGVAYAAHGSEDYTPQIESRTAQGNYNTADYAKRKFNVSSFSVSLGFRLL